MFVKPAVSICLKHFEGMHRSFLCKIADNLI